MSVDGLGRVGARGGVVSGRLSSWSMGELSVDGLGRVHGEVELSVDGLGLVGAWGSCQCMGRAVSRGIYITLVFDELFRLYKTRCRLN